MDKRQTLKALATGNMSIDMLKTRATAKDKRAAILAKYGYQSKPIVFVETQFDQADISEIHKLDKIINEDGAQYMTFFWSLFCKK